MLVGTVTDVIIVVNALTALVTKVLRSGNRCRQSNANPAANLIMTSDKGPFLASHLFNCCEFSRELREPVSNTIPMRGGGLYGVRG